MESIAVGRRRDDGEVNERGKRQKGWRVRTCISWWRPAADGEIFAVLSDFFEG